jgi:hypothetical protein
MTECSIIASGGAPHCHASSTDFLAIDTSLLAKRFNPGCDHIIGNIHLPALKKAMRLNNDHRTFRHFGLRTEKSHFADFIAFV